MKQLRSVLFVPGHKDDWIQKALRSGSDAIIIDLEDSVPAAEKEVARANARAAILEHEGNTVILVRPNGLDTHHFGKDVHAVAVDGLAAFLVPMLRERDDVVAFDAIVTAGEIENGVPRGTIGIVASFETASAIANVETIVSGPRIVGVMAAAAKDADVSRSVGFTWTPLGEETLYLRSRILVAARSVGLSIIVVGLWQDVRDLDGLRSFARANAGLGFTGQVIIHPTHAPIANEEYGLSVEEADYYRRLIAAYEAGELAGNGAVSFEGEHIDIAHAANAREKLARAGR